MFNCENYGFLRVKLKKGKDLRILAIYFHHHHQTVHTILNFN